MITHTEIEQLRQVTRKSAWLGAAAALLILLAFGFAGYKLYELEKTRSELEKQAENLKSQIATEEEKINSLREAFVIVNNAQTLINNDPAAAFKMLGKTGADSPYVKEMLAYMMLRSDRRKEALEYIEEAKKGNPTYAGFFVTLAMVNCAFPERSGDAKSAIKEALAIKPDLRENLATDKDFKNYCAHLVKDLGAL